MGGVIMDRYVTGGAIRAFREGKGLTQAELAERLFVSDKAVSKWETGRGLPDISLIEPLAHALGISVSALFSGESVRNDNRAANMLKTSFYVCPLCANVIHATGRASVACCGVTLPPLEAEECDREHALAIEPSEDEYYVTAAHPMTKDHYLSFLAAVSDNGFHLVKLYPEGPVEARFKINRVRWLYFCCNRHGLFRQKAEATEK